MALPVIAGVSRVTFNWTGPNGTSAANVIHVGGAPADPAVVMTRLEGAFTANMFNAIANTAIISSVDIIPLDGLSATQVFNAPATALWKGETAGDAVFPDSVLIKLRTGERGRSRRGRIYLPFPAEGAIVTGTVGAGSLVAMQAAWDSFSADMDTAGSPWVVASYKLASSLPVLTLQVEGALGTQRRRQSRFRRQVGF